MNNFPLVSVIIPLYNTEKYIAIAINSALAQTWKHIEILIINDGSTDNSLAIAEQFKSEKVKIFSQTNKGASTARNIGLENSKGEYIQFLDADDILSKNKIEEQLKTLMNFPNYIGLCATIYFNDGTDPHQLNPIHEWYAEGTNDTVDFLIKLYGGHLIGPNYGGMIQPNAWLIPRNIINKAGEWNETLSVDDDGEYFCRILLAARGIKYTRNATNYYRKFRTQTNLSSQKKTSSNISLLTATQLKAKYLLEATNNELAKQALSRLFWEIAFGLYTQDKKLSLIAENTAKELSPNLKIRPFNKGLMHFLGKIIGWKNMKFLQHIKSKQIQKY